MENYQLTCKLHWIPGKKNFSPNRLFRALGAFTSDYRVLYTVEVNFSSDCTDGYHNATLMVPFADSEELKELLRFSDIILLDGPTVIAVCNSIQLRK